MVKTPVFSKIRLFDKDFRDNDKNGIVDIIDFYKKNPTGMPLHYGE